ncbi:hypothetical protein ACWZHB_00855 [Nocardia sp. FBN12]|uniref:hypothetical protein n=1 Tax=Nocardia sp. FBN12 TaxID=3419766 RepID=UPI003D004F12
MAEQTLPDIVVIDHTARTLHVDGEEFPWHITDSGPNFEIDDASGIALITVTFMADSVTEVGTPAPTES